MQAIGVEPGPELRRLHAAILRQDPSLELPRAERELPSELDTGTPLVGREADLARLRRHWQRARDGAGRLVLVAGAQGIGKTRLAAELAAEVHREGGEVLYAAGADALERAVAAVRAARRPTLFVLDDLPGSREASASRFPRAGRRVALHAGAGPGDRRTTAVGDELRAAATLSLAPLDEDGVRAVARLYVGAREDVEVPVERLLAVSGGVPAAAARRRVGVGPHAGRAPVGRRGEPRRGRAARCCGRPRMTWRRTWSSCRRRTSGRCW